MFVQSAAEFIRLSIALLPALLPRYFAAWLVAFGILVYGFRWIKPRVRPHALRVDDQVRAWAKGLRFRVTPDSRVERTLLTWVFRFLTNFASAPSLGLISIVLPIWIYYGVASTQGARSQAEAFQSIAVWLLPALCYYGSMGLSYILKRVFKRLRPPIETGAFGHKLTRDPSFPSGHSLTSFAFWIMTALTLASYGASAPVVIAFSTLAVTIVALTGLSRIYLAVHFPSDVVGGYIIGTIWTSICYLALRGAFSPNSL